MGALGNPRRGGRFPPLIIGAFIACIIVLGFNYWLSYSRNQELQLKVFELDAKVRRAAAERSAVEMKKNEFQEQLRRQNEQITRIEVQHSSKLEAAKTAWRDEKENLLFNISSSTKTIQNMENQFNTLFENLGKLQKELQECQRNKSATKEKMLNNLMQCKTQLLHLEEECTAKIAASRLEVAAQALGKTSSQGTRNSSQASPGPTQAKITKATQQELQNDLKKDSIQEQKESPVSTQTKPEPLKLKPSELETNSIVENDGASQSEKDTIALKNKLVLVNSQATTKGRIPQETAVGEGPENGTERKAPEMLDKDRKNLKAEAVEAEADYDGEERSLDKQATGKNPEARRVEQDMEEMLADYNGDDENEGEFEADKQAELAER